MKFKTLLVVCLTAHLAFEVAASSVLITSAKDNTLYQPASGPVIEAGVG